MTTKRPPLRVVGASVFEHPELKDDVSPAAKAIATKAIVAAIAACKAGTCTPEQQAMVTALAKQAVQATGKTFEELKGDQRSLTLVLPPPAPPIPIEFKASDLAEAAKVANVVTEAASAASGGAGAGFRILGWIGENPKLALGIAIAAVGTYLLAPVIVPIAIARGRKG